MKMLLVILALFTGATSFGQSSNTAYSFQLSKVPDSLFVPKLPDFKYYSENYEDVFGEYYYSFNTMSFGTRNVYVSDTNFYYNGSQNLPYIQPLNSCFLPADNNKVAGAIGISVTALSALLRGNVFAKDYSPKNVDKSLFSPRNE